MKLVVLCGAAGAGKDTVADMLPARKLAFADVLYQEVGAAYNISVAILKSRATKEQPLDELRLVRCLDAGFVAFVDKRNQPLAAMTLPRSPRQILQLWGDYKRAQDPNYFVKRTRQELIKWDWANPGCGLVLSDCRFPNEIAMAREFDAELWQVQRAGFSAGATGHKSDTDGSEFAPDRLIRNNGSLAQLKTVVQAAWSCSLSGGADVEGLAEALSVGRMQARIAGKV